jgi:NADH:ubiquinone oxidoreductase subunit 2 (subunit N)
MITIASLEKKEALPLLNEDFASDLKNNATFKLYLLIGMLSFAGIPPFPGFFAKAYLLSSLISQGEWGLFVSVLGTSFITCIYYLRVARLLYPQRFLTLPPQKERSTG